jgi:hypothetical protein
MDFGRTLDRLVKPLNDTLDYTGIRTYFRKYVLLFFLREMAERRLSFWVGRPISGSRPSSVRRRQSISTS